MGTTDNTAPEEQTPIKESSISESNNITIDLSEVATPSFNMSDQVSQAQTKGKRRMTITNKNNKDAGSSATKPSNVSTADHKLLKVIKQEK